MLQVLSGWFVAAQLAHGAVLLVLQVHGVGKVQHLVVLCKANTTRTCSGKIIRQLWPTQQQLLLALVQRQIYKVAIVKHLLKQQLHTPGVVHAHLRAHRPLLD